MKKNIYSILALCLLFSSTTLAQTIDVSGKVVRHNGEALAGATVSCTNAPSVVSDDEGNFTFSDLPEGGTYLIEGMFDTDPAFGITILDFLFTGNIILQLNEYSSDLQILAGDVNLSGTVSTIDLIKLRKAITRIEVDIAEPEWVFLDGSLSFPNFSTGIILQTIAEDVTDLELASFKRGDIALEADHYPPPVDAPSPMHYFEDTQAASGEEFEVQVKVNDFQSIAGFQHALHWDVNKMEFLEFIETESFDFSVNENLFSEGDLLLMGGRLPGFLPISLDNESALYTIRFRALEDLNSIVDVLGFSDDIIANQVVFSTDDFQLYLLDGSYQSGGITSVNQIESLEQFTIAPNPVIDEFRVDLSFTQPEQASLNLYDINGRVLKSLDFEGNNFQKVLSLQDFSAGTYVLKLRTNTGQSIKRIIKQ